VILRGSRVVAGSILAAACAAHAHAAEARFIRIGEAEIRRAFAGRTFTDEVHWFFRFEPGGKLGGASMGRTVDRRWSVKDGMLCLAAPQREDDCREVWRAGPRIELRRYADDPVPDAGILKP
jgi:hypothetical protein